MKDILIFMSLITSMLLMSCSTDDVDSTDIPAVKPPKWSVVNCDGFEYNMSAIVLLPQMLRSMESDNDELAVFCGEECRGTAERMQINSQKSVWMMLVYGDNEDELYFKYYSHHNKSMYVDTGYFVFDGNGKYGTVDEPVVLSLEMYYN